MHPLLESRIAAAIGLLILLVLLGCFAAVRLTSGDTDLSDWIGVWNEEDNRPFDFYNLYTLQFQAEGRKLRFKMEAYSGTHQGLVEGLAKVNGTTASFTEIQPWNDGETKVTFHRIGQTIRVAATNVEKYGGMGIVFDGTVYHRGPPKEEPFPLSRGPRPLLTEQEEIDLKQLVTLDYPLVVAHLHMANDMDIETPDFRGKQVDGFVRGMASERLAMILVDRNGRMAVAVTDAERREIRVYSQLPGGGIPDLIRQWRSNHVDHSFVWVIK